jgi:hypothetical protein
LVNVLATTYRDSGNVGLSISAGKEAIRLSPKQTEAQVTVCSDYELQNQRDQARRTAGEVVAIDPSFRLSAYSRTQPYRDMVTLDRLIEVLRDAGLPD